MQKPHILIIGAGFAGVETALTLEKNLKKKATITIISNKPHFEYYPQLYRIVSGDSPLDVCIPITEIFKNKNVNVVFDSITSFNEKEKTVIGKNKTYTYDYLVLSLGSETEYFDIPGVKESTFSFKSTLDALTLKKHIEKQFKTYASSHEKDDARLRYIIIGGGPTGTELAGELACFTKRLAKKHKINPQKTNVILLEGSSRILSILPRSVTHKTKLRLQKLGVEIKENNPIRKKNIDSIFLENEALKTKTAIWAAGAKPSSLYKQFKNFSFDKKGRVEVNGYLEAKGGEGIFIAGDGANTPYTGMAQTAIHNGMFIGEHITRIIQNKTFHQYKPKKPHHAVPVGKYWAATMIGPIHIYGFFGWLIRQAANIGYFLSILSPIKAFKVFFPGKGFCRDCKECIVYYDNKDFKA